MKEQNGTPVARVGEQFLYEEDLKEIITEGLSKEDSTIRVNNFINQWATKQLLLSGAELNLNEDKLIEFEKLVEQYKTDLYTNTYLEALVKQNIDTVVSLSEATEVYERNKETFKLNEELIKFRYINLPENYDGLSTVEEQFKRFNAEDKYILDSTSVHFKTFSLNDSIWIRADQVISNISVLTPENKDQLLKKSNFVQLKDSLGLYLMQINDVLHRNDNAPMEYVMPTIKQIVLNKRKLEFIKQLEKDITKDAIKNKQFEIYD